MLDPKAIIGATFVMSAAAQSWIETASPVAQFVVMVIGGLVGVATLWYTIERARKIRQERKNSED